MSIFINVLLGIFVLVALLMILVILMQRPKSEGLGAAFGGGVTDNIFGAQTTNVLTRITGWLAGMFFTLTILLSILYAHSSNAGNGLRQELEKKNAAAAATVPATAAAVPAASAPAASPTSSAAVGAPGTVTNPGPGTAQPAVAPAKPLTPADQAVGVTAPAPAAEAPVATAAPTGSPQKKQ